MEFQPFRLAGPTDWDDLEKQLSGGRSNQAAAGIRSLLAELQAGLVIVESPYLDRDFTAEFSSFYSKLFRRFSKVCRRYHFFRGDPLQATADDPLVVAEALEAASARGEYLGFSVVRPTEQAPIGRTVLCAPLNPTDHSSTLLVRSVFETHVMGATLKVEGMPFIQQDGRLSACAQASIWMAARHVQSKHRGPWVSTVEIAEAALKPTDDILSQSIPAGSKGLSVAHMARALRAIGREALVYTGSFDHSSRKVSWPSALDRLAIIERYIDSGIPVILFIAPWSPGELIAHAVVACGHTVCKRTDPLPANPTRSAFCTHILVNDDQRGVALRMPIGAADALSQTPYTLENVLCVIVPLPGKVYIPAEHAEPIALDILKQYVASWPGIKASLAPDSDAVSVGDEIVAKHATGSVLARTYLTYGWKYRKRLLASGCSEALRKLALGHDLPRFVWVTEFGTFDDLNVVDEPSMRVFGHCVVDATSNNLIPGICLFHAPGLLLRYGDEGSPPLWKEKIVGIPGDRKYKAKIRGA